VSPLHPLLFSSTGRLQTFSEVEGESGRDVCYLPFLFILVMEGLSVLLKQIFVEGLLSGIKVSTMTRILHLLFADDVLILSKASLSEWQVIINLINHFCKASGLTVNPLKSTIHYEGVPEIELNCFKIFLPYTFSELSLGFLISRLHFENRDSVSYRLGMVGGKIGK
jgi:hypothetical protein